MDEKPFISIIVPYYNTPEKYFRRCVDSVARQTYGNYEMIVVDDGSSDVYQNVLDEMADKSNKIRILHKLHEGVSVARNAGVHSARYDYIMFLDSDDALTEYCLEEAAEGIVKEQPDLLIGLSKHINETEIDGLQGARTAKPGRMLFQSDTDKARLISHMVGWKNDAFLFSNGYISDGPWARVLKKSIADKVLFRKGIVWDEDTIWNMEIMKKVKTIYIVNSLWYKYLPNAVSSVRKFRVHCPDEFDYIIDIELKIAKKLWPNFLQGIYHKIFNNIFILCKTFIFHPNNHLPHRERYKIYKTCIHNESYKEALKEISFSHERSFLHRIVKEILRTCSYRGPHIVSYGILYLHCFIKQIFGKQI